MGGLAYKLGRKINWDHKKQLIEPIPGIDLNEALLYNEQYFNKEPAHVLGMS